MVEDCRTTWGATEEPGGPVCARWADVINNFRALASLAPRPGLSTQGPMVPGETQQLLAQARAAPPSCALLEHKSLTTLRFWLAYTIISLIPSSKLLMLSHGAPAHQV